MDIYKMIDGDNILPNDSYFDHYPVVGLCGLCNEPLEGVDILTCCECGAKVHNRCSKFTLNEFGNSYVCEQCFTIRKYIGSSSMKEFNTLKQPTQHSIICSRKYSELESRINVIAGVMEKFNFEEIFKRMSLMTKMMEDINKVVSHKAPRMFKEFDTINEKISIEPKVPYHKQTTPKDIERKIDLMREESKSLRAMNDKLLIAINEKDKKLREYNENEEKLTQIIDDQKQLLDCRNLRIKKMEEINEFLWDERESGKSDQNAIIDLQIQLSKLLIPPSPKPQKIIEKKDQMIEQISDFDRRIQTLEKDMMRYDDKLSEASTEYSNDKIENLMNYDHIKESSNTSTSTNCSISETEIIIKYNGVQSSKSSVDCAINKINDINRDDKRSDNMNTYDENESPEASINCAIKEKESRNDFDRKQFDTTVKEIVKITECCTKHSSESSIESTINEPENMIRNDKIMFQKESDNCLSEIMNMNEDHSAKESIGYITNEIRNSMQCDGKQSQIEKNDCTIMETEDIRPNVVILHDSLCIDTNEPIISKGHDGYITKKVPISSLLELDSTLESIEETDVIVIQALKISLKCKSVKEINQLLNKATSKALTKAKKVVICTIFAREDCYSSIKNSNSFTDTERY